MPRTAPAVTGAVTYVLFSMRMIDAQGDKRAITVKCDPAVTNAELEALLAATALITNADIYEAVIASTFGAVEEAGNADDLVVNSLYSNFVFTAKNAVGDSRRLYLPAPKDAVFIPESDNMDGTNANIIDLLTAWTAVLPAGFSITHGRYTERKETNPKFAI